MQINNQFGANETAVLLREITSAVQNKVEGDIVELGCYKGMTSLKIQKLLQALKSDKALYIYDSFAGLPTKSIQDNSPVGEQFIAGELPASKQEVIRIFKQAGSPIPRIKKAWFSNLTSHDMPPTVAVAFLDGDFYDSIMNSLKLVWAKLTAGSVIVIDDYQNEALPGVQKAVDEWLANHSARLTVEASLAIIRLK